MSFGIGSYNFSTGQLGYLGKTGNSFIENLGYGFGALANVSDVLVGFKPGSVELRTENDVNNPTKTNGNKDLIGHLQIRFLIDDLIDSTINLTVNIVQENIKRRFWKVVEKKNTPFAIAQADFISSVLRTTKVTGFPMTFLFSFF